MHVSLLIDLLTLFALARGLWLNPDPFKRVLCAAGIAYLLAIALHYYLLFAHWFGLFTRHPTMTALTLAYIATFFGGFWTFFGVMVLTKGVSYIALGYACVRAWEWAHKPRARGVSGS